MRRPRMRMRRAHAGGLVLVLIVVAVAWRVSTEAAPTAQAHRTLAAAIRIPGSAPPLVWPREGEAAVEAQGVEDASATSGIGAPVPIASVAKVMTAYVTLLAHPIGVGEAGFRLTIKPGDVAEERRRSALDESVVPVRSGERLSEHQALQALLLPSANNVAALLAEHEGGARAFVGRMNATAKELGMSSTTYTDPSGFDTTTVSSAADQLKLARAVMQLPAFTAIVHEHSAALPVAGRVLNYNALVGRDGYVGVKTGSDAAAGGCLMFAKRVAVGGRRVTVLGVVLGQRAGGLVEAALTSAQRLGDSTAAALRLETVLPAGSQVLSISDPDGRRTIATSAGELRALVWAGLKVGVNVAVSPAAARPRTGERVASVSLAGAPATSTAAVAAHALGGPSLGWRLSHLF
jgi:serine-type D-Ala-D-Ala carboxypeptidase (penicillin-binding protein 5/6)